MLYLQINRRKWTKIGGICKWFLILKISIAVLGIIEKISYNVKMKTSCECSLIISFQLCRWISIEWNRIQKVIKHLDLMHGRMWYVVNDFIICLLITQRTQWLIKRNIMQESWEWRTIVPSTVHMYGIFEHTLQRLVKGISSVFFLCEGFY